MTIVRLSLSIFGRYFGMRRTGANQRGLDQGRRLGPIIGGGYLRNQGSAAVFLTRVVSVQS